MITRSKTRRRQNNQEKKQEESSKRQQVQNILTFKQQIFEQAQMLCTDQDMNIQGMKYEQIQKDEKLKQYLSKLRDNLPKYQGMSSKQKAYYFKKITKNYLEKQDDVHETQKDKNERKSVSFKQSKDFVVFDQNLCPDQIVLMDNYESHE